MIFQHLYIIRPIIAALFCFFLYQGNRKAWLVGGIYPALVFISATYQFLVIKNVDTDILPSYYYLLNFLDALLAVALYLYGFLAWENITQQSKASEYGTFRHFESILDAPLEEEKKPNLFTEVLPLYQWMLAIILAIVHAFFDILTHWKYYDIQDILMMIQVFSYASSCFFLVLLVFRWAYASLGLALVYGFWFVGLLWNISVDDMYNNVATYFYCVSNGIMAIGLGLVFRKYNGFSIK